MIEPLAGVASMQLIGQVSAGLWPWILAALTGYLLGSIPFGLILTRAAGLGDVRSIGSGNIGATNVLRTGNKTVAAATLLFDGLKATVAVLLVHWALKFSWQFPFDYIPGVAIPAANAGDGVAYDAFMVGAVAGAAAVLGHTFPIWLGFKGVKGVATYIGATLGIYWPLALFFCGAWLLVALLFRISSLAALTAAVLTPAYVYLLEERGLALLLAALSALLIYKHKANIERLLAGEEPTIGAKGK